MRVRDLIEALQNIDQDALVVVGAFCRGEVIEGYDDADEVVAFPGVITDEKPAKYRDVGDYRRDDNGSLTLVVIG